MLKTKEVTRVYYLLFGFRFDFIFDVVGNEQTTYATDLLKSYANATYVTIIVPFLKNNDNMGLPFGLAKSVVAAGMDTMKVCHCEIISILSEIWFSVSLSQMVSYVQYL